MHANPQQLQDQERSVTSQLHAVPRRNTLGPFMLRFLPAPASTGLLACISA